jgi:phage terminase large subunit
MNLSLGGSDQWGQNKPVWGGYPDALRGIYLDGVVLDEYAQMSPRVWPVIRPALTDRQDSAVFIGPSTGHNQFYDLYQEVRQRKGKVRELLRVSKIQILPREELETARREMTPEEYDQEFGCSWQSAIRGAYTAS